MNRHPIEEVRHCIHTVGGGRGKCGYVAGFECKSCGPMCFDHFSEHVCSFLPAHTCHAHNCKTPCPPEKLMCALHWSQVPKDIQREVYRTYQHGQCQLDPPPSTEWHTAARAAINAVAEKEYRRRMIELGKKEGALMGNQCSWCDDGRTGEACKMCGRNILHATLVKCPQCGGQETRQPCGYCGGSWPQ
jgi:hypothetical protein